MHHKQDTEESYRKSIQAVIEVMRKDPSAPLDLRAMSQIACLSPFHFLRVFEELTSITPLRFLSALRVELAKRLLLETALPVITISYDVGYNSQGTFTRLFTDLVGASPTSFRRLQEEMNGSSFEGLIADYLQRQIRWRSAATVSGTVHAPTEFRGLIFLGLFSSHIPKQKPIAGTLLSRQGPFVLSLDRATPHGSLMAAGFPQSSSVIDYLLPPMADLLVGSLPFSCADRISNAATSVELTLRPAGPLDPPILIALPLLLLSDSPSFSKCESVQ
jgi:AraC-like DNA-binding protein